jgi:hypothetical protein
VHEFRLAQTTELGHQTIGRADALARERHLVLVHDASAKLFLRVLTRVQEGFSRHGDGGGGTDGSGDEGELDHRGAAQSAAKVKEELRTWAR